MIVDDFDFESIGIAPAEAKPPLIVDPDTVLRTAGTLERFEPVTRRQTQDVEAVGGIKLEEFAAGRSLNIGR